MFIFIQIKLLQIWQTTLIALRALRRNKMRSMLTALGIINWDSFSIGKGESVNITQPTSQSTLLNRVLGNNPSEIFGSQQRYLFLQLHGLSFQL